MALYDIINSFYGHFSRKSAHKSTRERERERARAPPPPHQYASFVSHSNFKSIKFCSCFIYVVVTGRRQSQKAKEVEHALDSLAPPSARLLQELDCFKREAIQLYLSFINQLKTQIIQRYEAMQYYSIGTQNYHEIGRNYGLVSQTLYRLSQD